MKTKYKRFNDTIFTNETAVAEIPNMQCGHPVKKHDCIHCCIQNFECNVAYIAYKSGSNLVDWCQLYYLEEFELMSAANLSTVPEYWLQKWVQNGGQPPKSELAVFGKNLLCVSSFETYV